jgi:hypothetical protein
VDVLTTPLLQGKLPTVERAEAYLREAEQMVPGPWVGHVRHVAGAARAIACVHPELDTDVAYVFGLLHDIGYRGGFAVPSVRHILDGHAFMRAEGYEASARICLTHSFPAPVKDTGAFASPWDCPPEERAYVQAFLDGLEYTAYDRLIQLCDCLSMPTGYCLVEKRFVDVVLRHGFNDLTLAKWRAYLGLRDEFDRAVGGSIYRLLPGVIEHTFGTALPK